MKKNVLRMSVIIAVILIAYNFAVFMIPCQKTPTFWISWCFTLLAFVLSGYAVYISLIKNPDARSRFYGFPIARIGVLYLIAQIALGGIFMALGNIIPWWVPTVLFAIGLAVTVIGLVSADAVVEQIKEQDQKLQKDVSLMRSLQSKVNPMAAQCEDEQAASCVKAFAEEMRYSDPVSSEAIQDADAELAAAVDALQAAIVDGNADEIKLLCKKASAALTERNRLCKLNKN